MYKIIKTRAAYECTCPKCLAKDRFFNEGEKIVKEFPFSGKMYHIDCFKQMSPEIIEQLRKEYIIEILEK